MFKQPYVLGPYIGALVATLFWMTVNYIRYNYDHNYKPLDHSASNDTSRDSDIHDQRDADIDQRK